MWKHKKLWKIYKIMFFCEKFVKNVKNIRFCEKLLFFWLFCEKVIIYDFIRMALRYVLYFLKKFVKNDKNW